jgi:pyruvate formate lyase activating enzyme
MVIAGFQKLSLIDFPGVIASVVFTQGCAFRCSYCHNPELTSFDAPAAMSADEIVAYLVENRKVIEGVCITGGEPTLQKDLQDFLSQIKKLGFLIKLDTTGINFSMLAGIFAQGLADYVAMDIKHVWEKYSDVVGNANSVSLSNCQKSFSLVQSYGIAHEFRTTVLPGVHGIKDFEVMAGYLKPGETYYIQQTRFTKTLDPAIQQSFDFDPQELVKHLQGLYPDRKIGLR